MITTDYAMGTYLVSADGYVGGFVRGKVLCSDMKVRALQRVSAHADSYFSLPAAVKVKGKSVRGYVTFVDYPEGRTAIFIRIATGKNAHLLPEGKPQRIKVGDRVTGQPPRWADGTPVSNWPDPHYVATVTRIEEHHGVTYISAKRDVMATEWRAPIDEVWLAQN